MGNRIVCKYLCVRLQKIELAILKIRLKISGVIEKSRNAIKLICLIDLFIKHKNVQFSC